MGDPPSRWKIQRRGFNCWIFPVILSMAVDLVWPIMSTRTSCNTKMNSERSGRKGSFATPAPGSSTKGEKYTGPQHGRSSIGHGSSNNTPKTHQLNRNGNGSSPKPWPHQQIPQNPSKGNVNLKPQPSNRGWEAAYMAPPPPPHTIPPPLQHGWQWATRPTSSNPPQPKKNEPIDSVSDMGSDDDDDDDDVLRFDSDEELLSDGYDSDMGQMSYRSRKKSKWFSAFFEHLEKLTMDEINEPSRHWHCPACRGGAGAIAWYRGLQPLITHARTKRSKRTSLHREFAMLLDHEMGFRGTLVPAGEAFGRWKGFRETTIDHEIVWPPMVVVMNTLLERDGNEKWIGMGNQELLDYFSSYDALKARHSYGPQGHRGMSVLIFERSAIGYLEAERLHKHFSDEGTDKDAWERRRVLFYPGGQRQLYGYLARKEDMDSFNQNSQGKSKLKFEMKSYQEMVVGPMKQMSEDNQLLAWYKNKVARQQQHEKALEQTMGLISNQLRMTSEENKIVRQRTATQHEENKEQMDYMEEFFNNQMVAIRGTLEAKERAFEKLLQEEQEKAKLFDTDSGNKEEHKLSREEIARFIDSRTKGIEEFEAEREEFAREHRKKMSELKRKYLADEVELEKEFDAGMTEMMKKYTPQSQVLE